MVVLWPMPTNPKHLLLVTVITPNIPVEIIANMMDGKQNVVPLQGRGITADKEMWRRLIQGIHEHHQQW
jgi:hypothetical protein